ncbi:DUF6086 family protein [Hamadaea tsunoensis]|uniref:DUF6086 family protein n=1 Tax=Hamadaea tsunoensis TaxID=53368 RepID=UPI000403B9A4|nr:DUF6086 family protein [Hamadaea tsunoensis]
MSQNFRIGRRILWNPSNRVARLFLDVAAAAAGIAEKPVGLRDTGADEHEVDLATFEAFVNALVRTYLGSNHPILRALLEDFLATALVLVNRAGGTVGALEEDPVLSGRDVSAGPQGIGPLGDAARLLGLAAEYARGMPV